ncbi:MAG: T9SS type A sorting domain-containing protein [Bacteroidetes bacterium]|nr:T9SS type A sorting domain-containing protein [Bacteroidota bacterium]
MGAVSLANAQFSETGCRTNLKYNINAEESSLTKDGSDRVSQVNGRSENSFDVTQAVTTFQPLWVDNQINGYPVLRFDANDIMELSSVSSADLRANDAVSFYAVLRSTGPGQIFNHESSSTAGAGKMSLATDGAHWGGDGDANKTDLIVGSSFQILHFVVSYDFPNSVDSFVVFINGKRSGTPSAFTHTLFPTAVNSNTTQTGTLEIGGGFAGDIAELFIFNSTHSKSERDKWHTYLSIKYNIPLDHTGQDTDYSHSDGSFGTSGVLWDLSSTCTQNNYKTNVSAIVKDQCYPIEKTYQWDPVEITRFSSSSLENDDYIIWANNGESMSNNFLTTNLPSGVGSYFASGWKVMDPIDAGTVEVTVDINDYVDNSHTINTIWVMIDTDDDGLYNDAPSGAEVFNPSTWNGAALTFSRNFDDCDAFTIGFTSNSPVPVELTAFNGYLLDDKIQLDWQTSQEIENEKFIIEHSQDGLQWLPLGEVAGRGDFEGVTDYSYADENPKIGINYYRLRQIDFDGDEFLSHVVTIEYLEEYALNYSAFPNPTDDVIKVVSLDLKNPTKKVKYAITDLRGRVVKSGELENGISEINVAEVNSGTYFLILQSGLKSDRSTIVIN